MKRPSGELISLDFYFGDRSSADGMRDVINHCLNSGASFTGEIIVCEFDGARNAIIPHVYSEASYEKTITQYELAQQLESVDIRVTTVGMWNAIGLTTKTPEIVTFNGISAEAPADESNPISIVGEGWSFSTPGYERKRNKDADKCKSRFIGVCKALRPSYAAILNEDSLTCTFDLQLGRGTRCFANFFIGEQVFGTSLLTQIESMYQDAYTERFSEGLYVATWMFAPESVNIDSRSIDERSEKVARIITQI